MSASKSPTDGTITVRDVLRGEITVENRTIDDYILVKSDGLALYHLAAMVDDHLMKITHVIRGSEWLPTLPLHSHIIRALGWEEPQWVHLSVFLKPTGKGKMSKREAADLIKDGHSIFVKDFDSLGYLPEAMVNWISLMGWSFDDHTEFFSLARSGGKIRFGSIESGASCHQLQPKLDHFNGLHIRNLPVEEFSRRIKPFFLSAGLNADDATLLKIAPIIQERVATMDESVDIAGFFFRPTVEHKLEDLIAKGLTAAQSAEVARKSLSVLEAAAEMTPEAAEPPMRALVEELGLSAGQVFGILRTAVTGQKVSPPLFESMEIIGKDEVINRLKKAISLLEKAG